jgi:hypothetical protein
MREKQSGIPYERSRLNPKESWNESRCYCLSLHRFTPCSRTKSGQFAPHLRLCSSLFRLTHANATGQKLSQKCQSCLRSSAPSETAICQTNILNRTDGSWDGTPKSIFDFPIGARSLANTISGTLAQMAVPALLADYGPLFHDPIREGWPTTHPESW